MRYNHITKKVEGRIMNVAPEKKARLEQLEKDGVLISSRHPSDEEMVDINKMWARRDPAAEEQAAYEARRKYGGM